MYPMDPLKASVEVSEIVGSFSPITLAIPKSVTWAHISLSKSTLLGFISQCTTCTKES